MFVVYHVDIRVTEISQHLLIQFHFHVQNTRRAAADRKIVAGSFKLIMQAPWTKIMVGYSFMGVSREQ